jgi:hypothetical protein
MGTPDEYRAFARECMRWAEKAKDLEHREALLDMATSWAEAAACLDYRAGLLNRFGEIVSEAKRHLSVSCQVPAIDGNGLSLKTNGGGQPEHADGISPDRDERQLPGERGETATE